jgi:hypothetical protein
MGPSCRAYFSQVRPVSSVDALSDMTNSKSSYSCARSESSAFGRLFLSVKYRKPYAHPWALIFHWFSFLQESPTIT